MSDSLRVIKHPFFNCIKKIHFAAGLSQIIVEYDFEREPFLIGKKFNTSLVFDGVKPTTI